jgi:hypothetical protein
MSAFREKENNMSKILGASLALALLVGTSAAYAWDQQATDEQLGYSINHRASPGTANSYFSQVPARR